ncbi:MAG TPA: RdgB/HAM1 family non-canonical purine NTP pyrophosphatase [Bryobacteraceae bacterium]
MRRLYACSTNPGKLREFALAAGPEVEIQPLPGMEAIRAPEESGKTFEENAVLKAVYYSRFAEEPVFADDSGLEVDALGGAPGVYSARFAGDQAGQAENNSLLLKRLNGKADRRARFVTALALAKGGELLGTSAGTAEGEILAAPRGENGFGYDPLFLYPPLGRTFAELTGAEKLEVSARGKALRSLLQLHYK